MSNFLLASVQTNQGFSLTDWEHRNRETRDCWDDNGTACLAPWQDGMLWPGSRLAGSDANGGLFGLDCASSSCFEFYRPATDLGNQGTFKISGTTVDSTGAPLPGCTIKGFLTATDFETAAPVTSDSAGNWTWCTRVPGAHYIVAYLGGAPAVAGVSVNTLIPT